MGHMRMPGATSRTPPTWPGLALRNPPIAAVAPAEPLQVDRGAPWAVQVGAEALRIVAGRGHRWVDFQGGACRLEVHCQPFPAEVGRGHASAH
eukprot:9252640-Pyramimonas_sp.AAC.1